MGDGTERLKSALSFTDEELALNRVGKVSPRQQALLTHAKRTVKTWNVMMIVVLIVFVAVAVGIAASSDSQEAPFIAGAVALVVVIMGLSIRRTLRAGARVATARVQHVEGPAKHHVVRFGGNVENPADYGGVRYDVHVGTERFTVPSEGAMLAFTEQSPYRAHFVREASLHALLSAEEL